MCITNHHKQETIMARYDKEKRWASDEWETLKSIQNTWFSNQDIMSITGFMNDEQFLDHVARYRQYAKEYAIENNYL